VAADLHSCSTTTASSVTEEEDQAAENWSTHDTAWDGARTASFQHEYTWGPAVRNMPSYGEPAHQPARCAMGAQVERAIMPYQIAPAGPTDVTQNRMVHVMPMTWAGPMIPYYNGPQPAALQLPTKTLVGMKRFCTEDFDVDLDAVRPKSRRIWSKRQDQILVEAEAEAAATAAAAAAATIHVPHPSVAMLDQTSAQMLSRAVRPSHHQAAKTTILPCCKFTSKHSKQGCKGELSIVTHKRGYLAVSCSSRHQWVWCALCCNCNSDKGLHADSRHRGCQVASHWFERDAFDTGARNHMNVHKTGNK